MRHFTSTIRPSARGIALGSLVLCACGVLYTPEAVAQEPTLELISYLTNEAAESYVVLYEGRAVQLSGCTTRDEVVRVLQLDPVVDVQLGTRAELESEHELGQHPAIACQPDAALDVELPMQSPIWADLEGSGRYFIEHADKPGHLYSVHSRCVRLKEALRLRARVAQPGVLQAEAAPDITRQVFQLAYHCGNAGPARDNPDAQTPDTDQAWQLFKTEVFLSEQSVGDWVYVAQFNAGSPEQPRIQLLPIYRIDEQSTHDIIWEASERSSRLEDQLAILFGIDPTLAIADLGFEQRRIIAQFPFLSLCIETCNSVEHPPEHAHFSDPALAVSLVPVASTALFSVSDLLGKHQLRWAFATQRSVALRQCDALIHAMRLQPLESPDRAWFDAIEQADAHSAGDTWQYTCHPGPDVSPCMRWVGDGQVLTQRALEKNEDCQERTSLQLNLEGVARIRSPLHVDGREFEQVVIKTSQSDARASLVIDTLPAQAGDASACLFNRFPVAISGSASMALELSGVDVYLSEEAASQALVLVHVENGTLRLHDVGVGAGAASSLPAQRAVRLCNSELYALNTRVTGSEVALQAVRSNVALTGSPDNPAQLTARLHAAFLNSGSRMRLQHASLSAQRAMQLSNAQVRGLSVVFEPFAAGAATSRALRLSRGAQARFRFSSVTGYGCVAQVTGIDSRAEFVFPSNNLHGANSLFSCGSTEAILTE